MLEPKPIDPEGGEGLRKRTEEEIIAEKEAEAGKGQEQGQDQVPGDK
jgi:hypothetical protein